MWRQGDGVVAESLVQYAALSAVLSGFSGYSKSRQSGYTDLVQIGSIYRLK